MNAPTVSNTQWSLPLRVFVATIVVGSSYRRSAVVPVHVAAAFSPGGGSSSRTVPANPTGAHCVSTSTSSRTRLDLFDVRSNGGSDASRAAESRRRRRRWNIPSRAVSELSGVGPPRDPAAVGGEGGGEAPTPAASAAAAAAAASSARLPYRIELLDRSSSSSSSAPPSRRILTVRHLDESDLNEAVKMCVAEFGSYPSSSSGQQSNEQDQRFPGYAVASTEPDLDLGKVMEKAVEPYLTKFENWYFAWVVRSGLGDRIRRCRAAPDGRGERARGAVVPDHNVVCMTERTLRSVPSGAEPRGAQEPSGGNNDDDEEVLVGMAELSLQPPDPYRTAPPYVLPIPMKQLLSLYYTIGTPAGTSSDLSAYVSNVLVRPDKRGLGYGRALMAATEGLARDWGYDSISLHVDADSVSGREAQALYRSMGYEGVPDDGRYSRGKGKGGESPYAWMGANMVQRGLYVVEGVPLLYLRKDLTKGR